MEADANADRTVEADTQYGFVSFFGEAVREMKAKNASACITNEVRREIGMAFKNLPPEMKSKYRVQSRRAEVTGHAERFQFFTRCAPERLAAAVSNLTDEQRVAVCEMGLGNILQLSCGRLKRKLCGWLVERIDMTRCVLVLNGNEVELSPSSFGYIMGLKDGGMPLQLEGDNAEVATYLEMFSATSRGIHIKNLAEILHNSKAADDRFKVTFMLLTLCTVLCPPGGVHISSGFLFSLKDVNCIQKRNWATFCFDRLIQGITRYKEENLAYVGGCILYLEMLFFNSVVYGKLRRDRSMCPLALWDADEIKRLMKWLENKGGYDSKQVMVRAVALRGEKSCCDRSNGPQEENYAHGENRDAAPVLPMIKVNWVDDVKKLVSISKRLAGTFEILNAHGSCSNDSGNNESGKDCIEVVECERGRLVCMGKEQSEDEASGCQVINHEAGEKNVSEVSQHTVVVDAVDSGIETPASRPCVENLFTYTTIQGPGGDTKRKSEPTNKPTDLLFLNPKDCCITHRVLPIIKIRPHNARFQVGPYVMPRPLGDNEEKLINYCMDEKLNKGEMLFQTKLNGISRNEIMSLCPKSSINVKIVSAVSEMLSAYERTNSGDRCFTCFLPAYNAQNVEGEDMDVDSLFGLSETGDFYLKNFGSCDKIFVPVNHGFAHWYLLVVFLSEIRVEIWDPLCSAMTSKLFSVECERLLRSLELVLQNAGPTPFTGRLNVGDFPIELCTREPSIPAAYDSALYVMLMMERHKIWSCLTESEIKFHSDCERARLVIELLTCNLNCFKDSILSSARQYQKFTDVVVVQSIRQAVEKKRSGELRRSR